MRGSQAAMRPQIVDLNLLPARQRPAELPGWAFLAAAIFIAAIVAMVPLGLRERDARAQADLVALQASDAEAGLHGLQVDIARQRGMRAELRDAEAQIQTLADHRAKFQGGTRPLGDDLARLWSPGLLAPGAHISAIADTDTGLRVEGSAANPLDAIAYGQRLVKDGGFASARLVSFAPGGSSGGVFSVEVTR